MNAFCSYSILVMLFFLAWDLLFTVLILISLEATLQLELGRRCILCTESQIVSCPPPIPYIDKWILCIERYVTLIVLQKVYQLGVPTEQWEWHMVAVGRHRSADSILTCARDMHHIDFAIAPQTTGGDDRQTKPPLASFGSWTASELVWQGVTGLCVNRSISGHEQEMSNPIFW
jgi:hypothetical protein